MTLTFLLTLLLSVLIGFSLGLLGGGGSILTVPILTYITGLQTKEAIATSLFVVGVTSAFSVITHARHHRVRWRTALIFGAASMAGAFSCGLLGGRIPGTALMIGFAVMMLAASVAMIRGRRNRQGDSMPTDNQKVPVPKALITGAAVGLITGLVGAGGGFLIVPALALLGGLPMSVAVGTSLMVIAMNSFAGLAGYLTTVSLDWVLVGSVALAAIAGSMIGSRLVGKIPELALRKGFGIFVLIMGMVVLIQELPGPTDLVAGGLAVLGAAALIVCWFAMSSCPLRARPAS